MQTQSANAGTTPFGPPTVLSSGAVGGMTRRAGAGRPRRDRLVRVADDPGEPVRRRPCASTCTPACAGRARPSPPPQLVDGSDDIIAGYSGNNEVAISPTGPGDHRLRHELQPRHLADVRRRRSASRRRGWRSRRSRRPARAASRPSSSRAAATSTATSRAWRPGRTAGWPRPGARSVGCGNANDISVAGAAFAGPEQPLSVTAPGAPRFLGALGVPARRAARRAVVHHPERQRPDRVDHLRPVRAGRRATRRPAIRRRRHRPRTPADPRRSRSRQRPPSPPRPRWERSRRARAARCG